MSAKSPIKIQLPRGRELKLTVATAVAGIIVIYMAISTAQALWQNYQLNQELLKLREANAELKIHNQYLQNLIAYRKTDSFKDKEARSKLNYQRPGETALIIPEDDIDRFTEGNIKDQPSTADRPLTNPEKWWQFIFG